MKNRLRAWEKERKLIPVMVKVYCRGKHKSERAAQGVKRGEACAECGELIKYALLRLDKCPFKEDKKFCSFCKIHCYIPEMREKIKAVMKYSGPRMLPSHPIFALSHAVQTLRRKRKLEREAKQNDR